ncbi:MAG: cell division protein FtsL [Bacillota bacterium]|nr:cell division protein FtsL [Bacillota bacterium]
MIIVNNPESYINGNTVLKPEFDDYKQKFNNNKKLQNQKIRERNLKAKMTVVRNIVIAFLLGVAIIWRYGIVYNMQANINSLDYNIKETIAENDSLNIKLATLSNLSTLEDVSTKKLNMVRMDSNQIVYSDLSKNNFKINKIVLSGSKSESGFIDKIMKLLF